MVLHPGHAPLQVVLVAVLLELVAQVLHVPPPVVLLVLLPREGDHCRRERLVARRDVARHGAQARDLLAVLLQQAIEAADLCGPRILHLIARHRDARPQLLSLLPLGVLGRLVLRVLHLALEGVEPLAHVLHSGLLLLVNALATGVLHGDQTLAQDDVLCLEERAVDAGDGAGQGDIHGRGALPEVVVQPATCLVAEDVVHGEEVLGVRLGRAHLVGNLSSHSEVHFVVGGTVIGDRAELQFLLQEPKERGCVFCKRVLIL